MRYNRAPIMAAALKIDPAHNFNPAAAGARHGMAREMFYTWSGIVFTLAFLAFGVFDPARDLIRGAGSLSIRLTDVAAILVVGFFVWGQLIYEWCRLGYLKSYPVCERPGRKRLEAIYDCDRPAELVVLVPAYCEPVDVLRLTLISAALVEHPKHTVTLLIDSPPDPADEAAALELAATRRLVDEIDSLFRAQERRYAAELSAFCRRCDRNRFAARVEGRHIAALYRRAAQWLDEQTPAFETGGHVAALFVERILREPAGKHRARAREIASQCRAETELSQADALHEYRRLAGLFSAGISSFERKRYVNLSHVSNKASNLNSYLGLLGKNLSEVVRPDGVHLEESTLETAALRMPDPEYLIICDADSLLLADYALKLLDVMERAGGERIGVAQVHAISIPNSPGRLQRIAGAQMDAHRVFVHGSSRDGAAFWQGDNAMIRRAALEEISEVTSERGFPIKRCIRDRTIIEDTETTIDFLAHGWEVFVLPDPEILAYVGAPGDFGSLLMQRRRWAGGGLMNVPKMLRYLLAAPDRARRIPEAFLRLHYLGAAAVNLGLLVLPILAMVKAPAGGWWLWALAPFYLLYARDLRHLGHNWTDVLRVQALNMLLTTVNIEGAVRALQWHCGGRRQVFPRTPKSGKRTPPPPIYIAAAVFLPLFFAFVTLWDASHSLTGYAVLGLVNTMLLGYALLRFTDPVEALKLSAGD
jgi:cellulose synthase/poly-beta-1,6-N-acetylglucosamine synthase-like glycosyltransferase